MFTPLERIFPNFCAKYKVNLFIKRDDLIHPSIHGNKYRKLKYNLVEVERQKHDTILTFGGAYSNHIHATAAAGKLYNLKTIGIIRGEEHTPLNATLQFAKDCGMQLHYVSRTDYRNKYNDNFIKKLVEQFGRFYLLPEGGTNAHAIKGCKEISEEILTQLTNQNILSNQSLKGLHICTACGTGGTITGMIEGLEGQANILGFSSLKGDFLTKDVNNLLSQPYSNWKMNNDYHFGGYAKRKPALMEFIEMFKTNFNIQLEPIYTGKMLFGIFDLIQKGYFEEGSTIVAVHTGGLQGL